MSAYVALVKVYIVDHVRIVLEVRTKGKTQDDLVHLVLLGMIRDSTDHIIPQIAGRVEHLSIYLQLGSCEIIIQVERV